MVSAFSSPGFSIADPNRTRSDGVERKDDGVAHRSGRPSQAASLDWLEKAFDYRDPNLPYLRLPAYDPLRTDPRFQALVGRLGLTQ